MIYTGYPVGQFAKIGYTGFSRNHRVNNERFSISITQNKNSAANVSTNTEDIISNLENGNKEAINVLEKLGLNYSLTEYQNGYKINFEQNGNKYTVAYNGGQTNLLNSNNTSVSTKTETQVSVEEQKTEEREENNYQNSLNDLFTSIEQVEAEKKHTDFNDSINSVKEAIESYKTQPNADTKIYEDLESEINQIQEKLSSINSQKNEFLNEKAKIQTEINNLKAPTPPSKNDYTEILSDGSESINENEYASALEQYEKEVREYDKKNEYLVNQMNNVINQISMCDLQIKTIESDKNSIQTDFNSVSKLQDMINNEKNAGITESLLENQKNLSEKISKNIQLRNTNNVYSSLFTELEPGTTPLLEDYTYTNENGETVTDYSAYNQALTHYQAMRKVYNSSLNTINKLVADTQVQTDKNNAEIDSILFNSEVMELVNELNVNGTGSTRMSQIIEDCTNEYNQILQSKVNEQEKRAYLYAQNIEAPEAPMNNYSSEEEFERAINVYSYQKVLYEKRLQEQELRNQLSEKRIKIMDEKLEEIRRLLFGTSA